MKTGGIGCCNGRTAIGSSGEPSQLQLSSAEIYSRIARGANACWFGPRGRLGATHILHADVAPSMNGGAVEMVVHERATDQPKPWGYKSFRDRRREAMPAQSNSNSWGGVVVSALTVVGGAASAVIMANADGW